MSHGLVFAHEERLKVLTRRGHFVVMDSTHSTNELGWMLYNMMVRDECSQWVVAAHILTAREDSDIVAVGLREVVDIIFFGTLPHVSVSLFFILPGTVLS